MHKYLRAVGFSNLKNRDDMQKLIDKSIREATGTYCVAVGDELLGDYCLKCGDKMGVAICGDYDESDEFYYEHLYPYIESDIISTKEKSIVDRHIATRSFAGVVEDNRIGISIIYYLRDRINYIKKFLDDSEITKNAPITLTGLSESGMILMPIEKSASIAKKMSRQSENRDKLVEAARQGNDEALESLTLDDIDVYTNISRQLIDSDVYSIVDTCFMPYGAECDLYTIIGEITSVSEDENYFTGEHVYRMGIVCNGLSLDICINKTDLFGEPEVGRRFKGTIWLQGRLIC